MTKNKHRKWDVAIKLIGSLITILTIAVGVCQYKLNNEREYKKRVYDEQLNVFTEFIESSVKLSNWRKNNIYEKDEQGNKVLKAEFKTDYTNFVKIYYGRLRLMQTENIDTLATQFFVMINQYRNPYSKVTKTDLDILLGKVINESKKSLQNTWNIDIKQLR